jgi:hypothetical protein
MSATEALTVRSHDAPRPNEMRGNGWRQRAPGPRLTVGIEGCGALFVELNFVDSGKLATLEHGAVRDRESNCCLDSPFKLRITCSAIGLLNPAHFPLTDQPTNQPEPSTHYTTIHPSSLNV